MSVTDLAVVTEQIQKYWSPVFTKRLRETLLLANFVNKTYEGAIAKGGDTVKVSQIVDFTGQLLTVGVDADTFDTEQASTVYVDIVANKRAVAAVEFADLVSLQSQIDNQKIQDPMLFGMNRQINTYLYSLVNPSASAPDLQLGSTATMDASVLASVRKLAGQQKWMQDGSWFCLMDPSYWSQTLGDTTLASALFIDDQPMVAGQKARKLFGFNAYEDTSLPNGLAANSYALFAHPDFLHYVQQTSVQVKVSDLHAIGKFGYKLSVDLVFGAALGNQGNLKHIIVTD